MKWTKPATLGLVMFLAGCAKTDCTKTRDALARVAEQMQEQSLRSGEGLGPTSFASRMEAEIGELEIEEPQLREALGAFVDATRQLAEKRAEHESAALELAEAKERLSALRDELDEAYAALGRVCESDVERCLMRAELSRIEEAMNPDSVSTPPDPAEEPATRIREIVEETTKTVKAMMGAQKALSTLEADIAALERRAAGMGLAIGGHCSG